MPASHQYLTASNLGKIKRILAEAYPTMGALGINHEAARFLMRKFQEGIIDEVALAEVLNQYVAKRNRWQLVRGEGPEKLPH